MDETERLRSIIMSFRVFELQMLLGYAQRNKSGTKAELQKRAMTLIQKPLPSIMVKIHEIQRSAQVKSRNNQTTASNSRSQNQAAAPHELTGSLNSSELIRQAFESLTQVCMSATNGMGSDKQAPPMYGQSIVNFPIQPDVRFKKLPFCEELSELLKASSLIPMPNTRMQVSQFDFHLTPQQVIDIGTNRMMNAGKVEYHVQVQVRLCLMETTCEQSDLYPPHLAIKINNRFHQLPVSNTPRCGHTELKSPFARPLDITGQLRLSPTSTNTLTVEWMPDYGRAYAVRVALVRRLTANELLRRLRARASKPAEYTRGLIKEKLAADEDTEISCSSWRVSVCCPLSKSRMRDPCRPAGCRHLQCFDAAVYLKMNECKPTWQCPICDKPAPYEDLTLDGYFTEVINSPKITDSNDLFINCDGTWHQNADVVKIESNRADSPELVILDDTDTCIDLKDERNEVECIAESPPLPAVPPHMEEVVVDLTLSDSDDDVPLSVLARSMRMSDGVQTTAVPKDISRKSSADSVVMLSE